MPLGFTETLPYIVYWNICSVIVSSTANGAILFRGVGVANKAKITYSH